jgi:glycosyltransferase involved in cell wall biosynthesis
MNADRKADNQSAPLVVAIIATLDGFANSTQPLFIKGILTERGHTVTLVDTNQIARASARGILRFLPSIRPMRTLVCLTGVGIALLARLPNRMSAAMNGAVYLLRMRLRARILSAILRDLNPDVIVCESQIDSGVMRTDFGKAVKKIYNCATPFAEELYLGGQLSRKGYEKLRAHEIDIFQACDHLSFHWHSYGDYVRKHYGYTTPNIFTFDRHADVRKELASFREPPRVIYLGYLGGYWIDLDLLATLSRSYPHIDVYGLPEPPRRLGLNYKGYATPDILRDYQFGLITCTKDQLRREGFSAKHIDYLAAGLPVLAPDWRTSTQDLGGTVTYSVENFAEQLRKCSDEAAWTTLSKEALEQATELSPERVAAEFLSLVEGPRELSY